MGRFLLLFIFCITCTRAVAWVAPKGGDGATPPPYAGRVALVIGNDNYDDKVHFPGLKVCRNDADSMAVALKACGFFVISCKDANRATIFENIDKFVGMLPENDVALVYYSGHGAEMDNKNFMIPTDLMNPRADNQVVKLMFENAAVNVQATILSEFSKRKDKINFLIMDACRVNLGEAHTPEKKGAGSKGPKTDVVVPHKDDQIPGTAIVFATGESQKSFEAKEGTNSVFTNELLKHLLIPNLSYKDVFFNAAAGTEDLVSQFPNDYAGLQQPQIIDKITKKFMFVADPTKKAQPEVMKTLSMPAFVVKTTSKENAVLKRYQNADMTYGFQDDDNKIAILPKYDYADEYFHDGLAFVQMGKKFGFINRKGDLVVPCIFDKASSFSHGRALVYAEGKYGFIDNTGAMAIPLQFSSAASFSEGLAAVRLNDKFGFIDNDGKLVIPYQFEEVGSFNDGRACVKVNGKYGFIDNTGNIAINCIYDQFGSFKSGYATMRIDDRLQKITPDGQLIKETYTTQRY